MDDFSLYDDGQSLGSGFVIHPGGGSVSIITDDFTHSSDEETVETPLAHIIGRSVFNVFTSNKITPSTVSPLQNQNHQRRIIIVTSHWAHANLFQYPPPNQYITTTKVREGRKDEQIG